MVKFLSVLCWLSWTLPLRGWWEGIALWRKQLGVSIASLIIWIQHRWVCTCSPLHGWEMTCLCMPGTLSVSMYSLDPSSTSKLLWPFELLHTEVLSVLNVLGDTVALSCDQLSDRWWLQETQQGCIRGSLTFHLLESAKVARARVADRSKLKRKVVPGIVPVSDSVFLAWPFNAHVHGGSALRMRETVTKCVKVIWGFLIALTSNFKCAAHVPRLSMGKHTWQFLHFRETGTFGNTQIAVCVGQIHIYKRQPGYILCLQQAVESSKLNSATQLSLTECWISERICILEKCMTGGPHTH